MKAFNLIFKPFGESALLIEWPAKIDEDILEDILTLKKFVDENFRSALIESVSAYNSLTLIFDQSKTTHNKLQLDVENIYASKKAFQTSIHTLWKIPVCYDEQFGIDLNEIANAKNLSIEDIITQHCKPTYTVFFIGFLPGFLYLGGLPDTLHQPRKSTPRLRIKKGAVAIGGNQTGVYPIESPGGWNILGNSPLSFFDPQSATPSFASPGDKLQFYSIQLDHYYHIKEEVEIGRFKIEGEVR